MQRYQEWVQNKAYQKHLNKLSRIKIRPLSHFRSSQSKLKTSFYNPQTKLNKPTKPLKPLKQDKTDSQFYLNTSTSVTRQLFKSIHTERTMTLHQKQILLQNYLLCRRLHDTPSVIKKQNHERQYTHHQRILKKLVKSKSAAQTNRDNKFNKYQSEISNISTYNTEGKKYRLRLWIGNIILINNKIEAKKQCLYQIILPVFKKHSQIMNYDDFTRTEIEFNISKIPEKIRFKIVQIKGLDSSVMGEFNIDFANFNQKEERRKKKCIEIIKNKNVVQGTVELSLEISLNSTK